MLGERGCPEVGAVTYHLPHPCHLVFWVYNQCTFSGVSLLGSWSLAATLPVDVDHPESQEVLVSKEACLQFDIGWLSGATIAPFRLWLPPPACLWWGMGPSAAG